MNDFPVRLRVDRVASAVRGSIKASLLQPSRELLVQRLTSIVRNFFEAAETGMLAGEFDDPLNGRVLDFEMIASAAEAVYSARVSGIDHRAWRILAGMFKGDLELDGQIDAVVIEAMGDAPQIGDWQFDAGRSPFPGDATRKWSFEVSRVVAGRRDSGRMIRFVFQEPPSPHDVVRCNRLQRLWRELCCGGFAPDDRPAYEYFASREDGYMVSPRMFEAPIGMFENPESAFFCLLCGIERLNREAQAIRAVRIY